MRLEPIGEGDFPRLINWAESAEFLMQWAGPKFAFPLTLEQLQEHLAGARRRPPERLVFKAVDSDDGSVIGHVELDAIDPEGKRAFLARVLVAPEVRRRGHGRAIVHEALQVAFGKLGLERVELNVFEDNAAAVRLYDQLGFRETDDPVMTRRLFGREWRVRRMKVERAGWLKTRRCSAPN